MIDNEPVAQIAKAIHAKTGGNVEGKLPEWWAGFIGMVLDELQSTGRLFPAGGMALTAEQVDGLKFVLEAVTSVADVAPELRGTLSTPVSRLVKFLHALFPATEPAAVHDGSDLVVVERSHTAKAVQSWMTLDLWTDLGKNDKDFDAEYERQGFGDLWATLLGEVRALVQATTPAPAEPAEEETKAEAFEAALDAGMDEMRWEIDEKGGEVFESAKKAIGAALFKFSLVTSSPVVPAPTETEWQAWQEVPEGVKYSPKARPPAGSPLRLLAQPLWVNRGGTRYQARSGTVSKIGDVEMFHYAPFVAAKEG